MVQNSEDGTKKFLALINFVSQMAGYKNQYTEALALLYANDKHTDKEIRKTITVMVTTKSDNQDKPNQGTKEPYNGNFKHQRNGLWKTFHA